MLKITRLPDVSVFKENKSNDKVVKFVIGDNSGKIVYY